MDVTIYTDGAARGNPGKSASGFAIYSKGRKIHTDVIYNGVKTNNFAEYTAIIRALEWCTDNIDTGDTSIKIYSDSELVVRQLGGLYKTKSKEMKRLYNSAKKLEHVFVSVIYANLPREAPGIARVDKRLNVFLDSLEKRER